MKTLLPGFVASTLLVTLLGSDLKADASRFLIKDPPVKIFSPDIVVNQRSEMSKSLQWVFTMWEQIGYLVPPEHEQFYVGNIAGNVRPINIEIDDAVMFWDGSRSAMALVVNAESIDTVIVVEPISEYRLVILHGIDRLKIEGAMRPLHRHGDKVDFHKPCFTF